MDTSEQYIKMCEKAEEIQGRHWKIQSGDYYRHGKKGGVDIVNKPERLLNRIRVYGVLHHRWDGIYKESCIWLPRQDQLQAMVKREDGNNWFLLEDLHEFMGECLLDWDSVSPSDIHTPPPKAQWHYASMEQLWLAFVMKEKYNKIWDGEQWVYGIESKG